MCLDTHIRSFMKFYWERFPSSTVFPKLHIMEEHIMPWVKKWKLGLGIMGEQGAESLHDHMMRLERTYQGIPDDVERLKHIVREQIVESSPSLLELQPPPQPKRRKKDYTAS